MAAPLSRSAAAAAAAAVAVATLLAALTGEVSAQRRGSRLASGAPSSSASNAAADFDCPEEFGYYPHPTDCTQYYVCVFGGALVESCTGGLMYSHELQTCDWPRNVGCGAGEGATVSTVRVTDPRTRQTTPSALPPSRAPVAISRGQQEQQRQQQEEIVKHQLYAEDVGPAEEVEIDRQQRVYRGQPSTLGQVQRDRDGLRHQPVNNVIPAPTGRASSGDKIAVISFGTQQQVQPAQYRVEPSNSYQPQPQSAVPTNPTIYNSSQQYDTAAQYDPYYNNYDEDVELYRDIDYGQYTGSQNNQQQPYRGNQNTYKTAPQPTAPQRTNSYVQPSYSSQDVYTQQQQPQQQQQQQDYSDSYNTQLSDEQYREPSRTPSRPQSRGRGENAATARAGPSQNDKTEELDGSLNLSSLAFDTPRSSSRPPTASTRQQQFQARGSNTESEGRRSPIRSTPRTSTSLEDTLSEDQKSPSRGQASSRRTSPVPDSPGVKSRFSETASLPVSRAVPQKQQTSSGRRAPVKYYESSDTSQGSRSSAKNPELTSIEGFRQGSSENRRGPLLKSEASPDVEAVITPRSQKVVAESFQPARLISSMDDTQNDDDEIADPDFPSKSLSRNSIVQSEPSTTSRSRSRGSGSAKQAQCSDDVDSNKNTGCIEKQQVSRIRPTTASPESQTTPTPSRTPTVNRNRGSSPYVSNSGTDTVNRGTPASVRTRPTLKPSTAFVSKAQEFVDIYKYPPSRPAPVYPQPQVDKTAAKCRKDVCLLPDCFCGGKDIPGDLRPEEVPQLVLLTFDDAVNDLNKNLYRDLFEKGRRNPNGCDIAATFYVSHEWTDYGQVQDLYAAGHEIATHSVSHSFGEQFSQKKWSKEIGGQREILAQYGGVRLEDVRGMRAPFLAIGGNKMFKMLYDLNFTYDSSMPVYENRPPSWPYTLDYKIFHDCMIPPCPTRSYPGVWEVPMVMWQDLNGGRCSMGDACSNPPTADGVYKMLIKNFERHYTTNRAPFGLFYHAAWFTQPHHKEGFEAFLDTIVAMDDVWLVTNWQAIQWVRQPTPLSEIKNFPPFQCNYADRPKKCNNPKVCNLWHKSGVRYMRTCQACPEVYPWTGKTGVKNSRIDNEIYEET
ncbi:uncharacterized protein LOC124717168 isoform X2 [Schistocerca piceifrons]|uniref:uncharacterized protein LOC124717168 isoform X2 n=1 Tax=Schistocerca piceifrons TaxID=274613 RepID=UPI001F5F153B|nr:uncharacterized protein LOC124717168 isoform X2 [Schistocerca piceifrons]